MLFQIKETADYKKIYIFFGLISFKILYHNPSIAIRIFGINILTLYLFNGKLLIQLNIKIPIPFIDDELFKAKFLYNCVKENYTKDFDCIYSLCGSPSGETYIILNLLNIILRKNCSKQPILVVDKMFKYQLCKLFQPEIPVILCKNLSFLYFNKKNFHKIKGCKVYNYFPTQHYIKQDILINTKDEHYFSYIVSKLDLNRNLSFNKPKISDTAKQNISLFIKENNLKNFVIIAPEANTCSEGCINWTKICNKLQTLGYKVVLNITDMKNYIPHTIPVLLTYEEMFILTQQASAFIGLRSGLVEILSQCSENTPFFIFYTDFPKRGVLQAMSAEKALSGFTLKKLPNVNKNNITELVAEENSIEELFKKLKKKKNN